MNKKYRLLFSSFVVCFCFNALCQAAPVLEKRWETGGFKTPESVTYDEKRDVLYVSNVNGVPTEKDKNGFISRVSLDGEILDQNWISEQLNAPKGLAIIGDSLYVADIDTLVEIDITKAAIANRYTVAQAQFLNDVTAHKDGNVYVSDMMTNTIHRLKDGQIERWLQDAALESPNGLLAEAQRLVVGSWGPITEGFKTERLGHLKAVSLRDKAITRLGNATPVGNLDGVEADGKGNYYVTDWIAGKLFHIQPNGTFQVALNLNAGTADHEVLADKALIIIPLMNEGLLMAYEIKQ